MHSTLRSTVPPAVIDSMVTASLGAWNTMNTSIIDYWVGAFSRRSTPWGLLQDLGRWTVALSARQRPPWAHESQQRIVGEWSLARLRDYSAPDADPTQIPTVILPPQAGHASSIVDFTEAQSQVMVGRENGCTRIFSMDWIGATQETKDCGIDDYMALLREVTDQLGGKVNLVGDCQGGWLATIFAALHPDRVNTLAIAGAPIDFHAGEPLIHEWLSVLAPEGDMSYFRSAVAANDGVLPGRFLLDGFKALQPDQEFARTLQLLNNVHDSEFVERHRIFEDWFQWTQAIPGAFYLWIVEHLFIRNSLIKGELQVEGRTVDLKEIDCPLFLMAGRTDHITPADQVWALADYSSTPAERIGRQSASSGHLGLFMSNEALAKHWTVIFAEMGALSTPTLEDDPNVLTDEPTRSQPTMFEGPAIKRATRAKAATSKAATSKAAASKSAASSKTASAPAPARETTDAKAPTEASTTGSAAGKTTAPKAATRQSPTAKAAAPKAATTKAAAPRTAASTSTTTKTATSGASKPATTRSATSKPATTTAAKRTTSTGSKASAAKPAGTQAETVSSQASSPASTTSAAPKAAAPKAAATTAAAKTAPAGPAAARQGTAQQPAAPQATAPQAAPRDDDGPATTQ